MLCKSQNVLKHNAWNWKGHFYFLCVCVCFTLYAWIYIYVFPVNTQTHFQALHACIPQHYLYHLPDPPVPWNLISVFLKTSGIWGNSGGHPAVQQTYLSHLASVFRFSPYLCIDYKMVFSVFLFVCLFACLFNVLFLISFYQFWK